MHKYFIIGTDTDCGKTYVTCELLKYFKKQSANVIGLKPLASGCGLENNSLISDDARKLQLINGSASNDMSITPWRFQAAIAPHIAAKAAGVHVSASDIVKFCSDPRWNQYNYVLIEGAGGLLVPLNESETWVDVLLQSQIPVILVVGMRLGCLNHALLTASVLKSNGIICSGWVANVIDNNMAELESNIQTLVTRLESPLLGCVTNNGEFKAYKV